MPVTRTPVCSLTPRLLNDRADDVGRLDVDAGQDARQRLEERHLAADVGQQRRELAADRAAADDQHAGRHLVELEHVVGRQDALAVEVEPGQRAAGASRWRGSARRP